MLADPQNIFRQKLAEALRTRDARKEGGRVWRSNHENPIELFALSELPVSGILFVISTLSL
jgi:hypothetical protein